MLICVNLCPLQDLFIIVNVLNKLTLNVIPNEVRNLKISQSLRSFEMTTFFSRRLMVKN